MEEKSLEKLWRNSKGVTPVLSSLLLTVIALAGMSIAVAATYVITNGLHDNMSERLIVEDVWFTNGHVSLYVGNVGRVAIKLDAVYVDRVEQSFTPLELEQGQRGWLNVSFSWNPNSAYEIKIATKRGTKVVDFYMSPS